MLDCWLPTVILNERSLARLPLPRYAVDRSIADRSTVECSAVARSTVARSITAARSTTACTTAARSTSSRSLTLALPPIALPPIALQSNRSIPPITRDPSRDRRSLHCHARTLPLHAPPPLKQQYPWSVHLSLYTAALAWPGRAVAVDLFVLFLYTRVI